MNSTFGHRLSQAWFAIQDGLFPETEHLPGETRPPKLQQLIRTPEVARMETHLSPSRFRRVAAAITGLLLPH